MIHLLGIAHRFQFRPTKDWQAGGPLIDVAETERFERYLSCCVGKIEPHMLCEEASCPRDDEHKQSVASIVAAACGIEHQFCDPDPDERVAIYQQHKTTEREDRKAGYPVREQFWLNRLRPNIQTSSLIFICGANHVGTFGRKLEASGFATAIICSDLELEWRERYENCHVPCSVWEVERAVVEVTTYTSHLCRSLGCACLPGDRKSGHLVPEEAPGRWTDD